jgi:hypothetical protein
MPQVGQLYDDEDAWEYLLDEMPALPGTNHEAFLWHTFDSLANALMVLRNGKGQTLEGKSWREILHIDLHLMDVFVKPPEHDIRVGTELGNEDDEEPSIEYTREEVCSKVIL